MRFSRRGSVQQTSPWFRLAYFLVNRLSRRGIDDFAGGLIMEPGRRFRLLALPLAAAVWCAGLADPLVRRLLPSDTVTSGYFVVGDR